MSQHSIRKRALDAYHAHLNLQREEQKQLEERINIRRVKKIKKFLEDIGEDASDIYYEKPRISRGGLTFYIDENNENDDIMVSYKCNDCGGSLVVGPVNNLVELGENFNKSCPCDRE